ncbi:4-hydroxy-tetrahydrodipicolinate synthase [candidate division KSB1 bacterium]|nr:4-hydroxy-tetrahydrodipicolinate synthase [candidate division KSB1 bacterium]
MNLGDLKGCGPALVTPFHEDGSLDLDTLKNLVEFQISEGSDFLVPCGTTGESVTLSFEEHCQVVQTVVKSSAGRVPVIAGAGGYATAKVIKMAKAISDLGVDGLLSVAPYYNKPSQEGLFQHFRAIATSVDKPIILYNVPGRTASNILPETIVRLSEIENIIGVKEATGNISQVSDQAMAIPDEFIVLSGDDANTLPLISLGASGLISVAANEIPKSMHKLTHLCLDGKFEEARELQKTVYPLLKANFLETNPIPVKYALSKMGKLKEVYRLPLVPLAEVNKQKMDIVLKNLNLI